MLPTPNELDAPGLWLARIGVELDELPELPEIPDFPDFPDTPGFPEAPGSGPDA
jgi:hypothetical protein